MDAPRLHAWTLVIITPLTLLACGMAATGAGPNPSTPPAGTYDISICPGGCGPGGSAAVRGTLVLEDSAFSSATFPDSSRRYFEQVTAMLLVADAQRAPTACFALGRVVPRAATYAGLDAAGLTRWRSDPGGGVAVPLYRSPDATYVAYLSTVRNGLRGRGVSRGGGAERGSIPEDSIVARRLGPPDRSICARAAEAAAAEIRTRR
jgi:hypothetical protein